MKERSLSSSLVTLHYGEVPNYLSCYRDAQGFFLEPLTGVQLTQVHEGKRSPNTFFYQPGDEAESRPDRALHLVATKCDIGGIGGHIATHPAVNRAVLDHMMRHNRVTGTDTPIFLSVMVTSTGDDICITVTKDAAVRRQTLERLLWDAYDAGGEMALKLGLYGPKQDMMTTAFTGNLHGSGPASVTLPLPVRPDPMKGFQQVALMCGDKCGPNAFSYGVKPYYNLDHNSGLVMADSAMRFGYLFEVVDLDTRAQAIESGIHPNDKDAIAAYMDSARGREKAIEVRDRDELQLLIKQPRNVVRRIWTQKEEILRDVAGNPVLDKDQKPTMILVKDYLCYVASAERLHNIPNAKGEFAYGGKDDPVLLALLQGDCPAMGEFGAPWIDTPLVEGGCRGGHGAPAYPMPTGSDTAFWSGPILTLLALSINLHTGLLSSAADHFATGNPSFDRARSQGALHFEWIRRQGFREPWVLPNNELEYHKGPAAKMAALESRWQMVPAISDFQEEGVHELQAEPGLEAVLA